MAERSRVRVSLEQRDDATSSDHRIWALTADGEDVGSLEADRLGGRIDVRLFVTEARRGRGVATAALGQFLGLRAWPDAQTLRITLDPDNRAAAAVAASAGFSASGSDATGSEHWERAAPGPRRPRSGPGRFVDADGRIDRFPVRAAELRELLAWVADRTFSPGEVLSERALNERLSGLTNDVALLRRHMVDHGVLARTRSGSEYSRAEP
ncbi:GNAT family N-acetyltransferase [Micromonospora sp. DT81.3]|uniref:DUF2087 domain-containing protein n=1 Tax=Micromonospora sp. DT81.3 TaxID=3416523 RepID=UPI003CEADC09